MSGFEISQPDASITFNDIDLDSKVPAVRLYNSGQSVAHNTSTNFSFTTERWDTHGFWSSGSNIVIPTNLGGIYMIIARVTSSVGSATWTGNGMMSTIYVNGSAVMSRLERFSGTAYFQVALVSQVTLPLNAGDTIILQGYHTTTTSRTMYAEMGLVRLGSL